MFKTTVSALMLVLASSIVGLAHAAEKIIIQNGSPVPAAAYLDFYVAQRAGFFSEENLDVEIRYSQGAPQALQLAASGSADMGDVAFEPYLYGYEKGMRGKYYMTAAPYNIFFMGVPEDSSIRAVADLKGKTIGVSSMGSGSLLMARSMLRDAGINPEPSMFLPVGVGDSALQALRSGRVQALSLFDGAFAGLERAGVKLRYIHHPKIGFVSNAGLFISDASIEKERGKAIRLIRALRKAHIFIRENLNAALNIYWSVNPGAKQGVSEDDARAKGIAELKFMSPFVNDVPIENLGRFNMKDVAEYLNVMKQEGVFTADLRADDLASNELIDKIGKIDPEPVRERARNWR